MSSSSTVRDILIINDGTLFGLEPLTRCTVDINHMQCRPSTVEEALGHSEFIERYHPDFFLDPRNRIIGELRIHSLLQHTLVMWASRFDLTHPSTKEFLLDVLDPRQATASNSLFHWINFRYNRNAFKMRTRYRGASNVRLQQRFSRLNTLCCRDKLPDQPGRRTERDVLSEDFNLAIRQRLYTCDVTKETLLGNADAEIRVSLDTLSTCTRCFCRLVYVKRWPRTRRTRCRAVACTVARRWTDHRYGAENPAQENALSGQLASKRACSPPEST